MDKNVGESTPVSILLHSIMSNISAEEYKIHFAIADKINNNDPLDAFISGRDEWKKWNSWRGPKNLFSRKFIFSLIRYYSDDSWLFGGIFEILERNKDSYDVTLVENYQQYVGRLIVKYSRPRVQGPAIFNLENHFDKILLKQILESAFIGEAFCGYDNIAHKFSQLENIVRQDKLDWKTALKNVKGVYLIFDTKNGKTYVGSAYGDTGIWSRLSCYVSTGHGWNDELVDLISVNGLDYAREYLQFSVLETRPMRTDDQEIINRENYWKNVLHSRKFGYNLN